MRPCPACGKSEARSVFEGTDRLYRTTDRVFSVVACAGCGLLRMEPMPTREQLASFYPATYWSGTPQSSAGRMEEAYRRIVIRDHVRFVRRAISAAGPDGWVLDVGCGGGLFLKTLSDGMTSVLGLDFSETAARIAWTQNRIRVICGLLPDSPMRAGCCSVVTMFHVLEHVPDPAAYLRAAHRLLRPRGRLVVQVPNAASWQARLFKQHWNGFDVPRHLTNFREEDLRGMLVQCGFNPTRTKHFSLRDNPAGFATSLTPGLDPMARRVCGESESEAVRIIRDLAYFALTAAALPFTVVEAAAGSGSSIMVEAEPV